MLLFWSACFTLLMFLAVFLCGDLMQRILRKEPTVSGALAWGVVLIFTVFQVIAYPLYMLKASFMTLFYCFTAVLLALLVIAAWQMIRHKSLAGYHKNLVAVGTAAKARSWIFGLAVLAALVYAFVVMRAYPDSDDSYYMGRAMEVLARNQLSLSDAVIWLGFEVPGFFQSTDASTMEFLRAYLSFVSGIPVVMICRICMNVLFSVIHFAAVFVMADSVTQRRMEKGICQNTWLLLFYVAFFMLAFGGDVIGFRLTRFMWQGKSLLPAIIFPLLAASCADLIRNIQKAKFTDWFAISCVLVAGVSVSVVGLFLPVILYFSFGVAFLIADRFRSFRKIIVPAVLSAVPVVVIGVICISEIFTRNTGYLTELGACTWLGSAVQGTDFFQCVLYLMSVFYVVKKGSKLQKTLFVLGPLVLLATFLNPLLTGLVSTYVTTPAVYWRLFWLLPVYFLPAFMATDLIEGLEITRKRFLRIAALVCAVCLGCYGADSLFVAKRGPIFLLSFFYQPTNPYFLTEYVVRFADRIQEDWTEEEPAKVAHVALKDFEFRQYSIDYQMLAGYRPDQRQSQTELIPGTDVQKGEFYETMSEIDDAGYLHDMMTRLDADYYISTNADALTPEELEAAGFQYLDRAEQHSFKYGDEWFVLWRVS